jgi:hypothetical protein
VSIPAAVLLGYGRNYVNAETAVEQTVQSAGEAVQ